MIDPTVAAIEAWMKALRGAGLKAFDEVPQKKAYPYFALTSVQAIPEEDDCSRGTAVVLQFSAWNDKPDLRTLGPAVFAAREALRDDLVLGGHTVVLQDLTDTLMTKDPATGHAQAVMTLRLETEPV